jgi:hypothetical protein
LGGGWVRYGTLVCCSPSSVKIKLMRYHTGTILLMNWLTERGYRMFSCYMMREIVGKPVFRIRISTGSGLNWVGGSGIRIWKAKWLTKMEKDSFKFWRVSFFQLKNICFWSSKSLVWIRIRIQIIYFYNRCRGSRSALIQIRIDPIDFGLLDPDPGTHWECGSGSRRAKKTHNYRKLRDFVFWSAGFSLLRIKGFFCSLDVLFGGLEICKLQLLSLRKSCNKHSLLIKSCPNLCHRY